MINLNIDANMSEDQINAALASVSKHLTPVVAGFETGVGS